MARNKAPENAFHNMKTTPYWLEGLNTGEPAADIPKTTVDVAIVGSGYTGLSAALTCAEGGRSVVVLDKGDIGAGCSTRNGGQISYSIKPSLEKLTKKFGADRAATILQEGPNAIDWVEDFVTSRGIDCAFNRCGRFHAAHSPKAYEDMARDADKLSRQGVDIYAVSRSDQASEIGSDMYHGGVVNPTYASIDPGRYHRGMYELALKAGAKAIGNAEVTGIQRDRGYYEVKTAKGIVRAKDVIIATNGYTGKATPWLRRRVIPIGSYIIATEALDPDLMRSLIPGGRNITESSKVVYYYRLSPDGRRMIFGGRVSIFESNDQVTAPRLYRDMCERFPALEGSRVTHAWNGTVAYTFDEMMHVGQLDGMYYATGYCGSGVSLSGYLGMRVGQKVLGLKEGQTAFDDLPFSTRPFYTGKPWFLPPTVGLYRMQDNFARWRAR